MISEFEFIDYLYNNFNVKTSSTFGIGDDCAVISFNEKYSYLITKDSLIEDIHFKFPHISFYDLAYKSMLVNISDIIAMGGIARYAFISISLPKNLDFQNIKEFYRAIKQVLKKYHMHLLGGDTCKSEKITISITVIGVHKKNKILYRHNAKLNDYIYVSGYLGDSRAGLDILLKPDKYKSKLENHHKNYLIKRHIKPNIRFKEIRYLQKKYKINASIDISDGFLGDLKHILNKSNLKAKINLNNIEKSQSFNRVVNKKDQKKFLLTGGEDYEIIITSPNKINCIEFKNKFKIPLNLVGKTTLTNFNSRFEENKLKLNNKSFDHFN